MVTSTNGVTWTAAIRGGWKSQIFEGIGLQGSFFQNIDHGGMDVAVGGDVVTALPVNAFKTVVPLTTGFVAIYDNNWFGRFLDDWMNPWGDMQDVVDIFEE